LEYAQNAMKAIRSASIDPEMQVNLCRCLYADAFRHLVGVLYIFVKPCQTLSLPMLSAIDESLIICTIIVDRPADTLLDFRWHERRYSAPSIRRNEA